MKLLTAQGAGNGRSYPLVHERPQDALLFVWGTVVTDVDFQISPDGGTTWIDVLNITAAGAFKVFIGGDSTDGTTIQIRGIVTTGTAVEMALVF